jgi:sec-independent protein translocase protein TatA
MTANILIGVIGPWQIIIIVVLVLLLFGGRKIPELMKGLGQGIREFKDGMNADQAAKKDEKIEEKKKEN